MPNLKRNGYGGQDKTAPPNSEQVHVKETLKAISPILHSKAERVNLCVPSDDAVIIECLINYWIKQGMDEAKAAKSAKKAISKLKEMKTTEDWCLLPE